MLTKMKMRAFFGALLIFSIAACEEQKQTSAHSRGPVEVFVMRVEKKPLTITSILPGRTSAYRIAEIRPQVTGIILKRLFEEGAMVKTGQQLYQIDPAPYAAMLASARAGHQRAEAIVIAAQAKVDRYQRLRQTDIVSVQNMDDAIATLKQAQAEVAGAKATIDAAQINLKYTLVSSPITGRIGKSNVTEGALVTANQANTLTVVQQINPIYVDMTQSATQLLRLRREFGQGQFSKRADSAPVSLILEGANPYGQKGELKFSDVTVDRGTATVQLRALFPNADGEILPGLFVKARIEQGVRADAILIPQRAVGRGIDGTAIVWVVNDDDTVSPRPIETERAMGNAWLVSSGLKGDERIVIEGLQKISPGVKVKPVLKKVKIILDLSRPSIVSH